MSNSLSASALQGPKPPHPTARFCFVFNFLNFSHHQIKANSACVGMPDLTCVRYADAAFLGSAANYTAGFFGKYLNAYGEQPQQPVTYVPPGWTEWCALQVIIPSSRLDLAASREKQSEG